MVGCLFGQEPEDGQSTMKRGRDRPMGARRHLQVEMEAAAALGDALQVQGWVNSWKCTWFLLANLSYQGYSRRRAKISQILLYSDILCTLPIASQENQCLRDKVKSRLHGLLHTCGNSALIGPQCLQGGGGGGRASRCQAFTAGRGA